MGADKHEKQRKAKGSRYVQLFHFMLNCPAWRSLSPVARAVYVQIASRYMGSNNGRIPYAVREGEDELGVGKSTVQRALNDLVQRGFIVLVKDSKFTQKLKHAREWRLTEHFCDISQRSATKDFMRWEPSKIQNSVPVVGLTVPVVGPSGTCGGTVVADMSRNGTCGGTVNGATPNSRYLQRDTSSLPGSPEAASASLLSSSLPLPSSSHVRASPQLVDALARKDGERARRAPHRSQASGRR